MERPPSWRSRVAFGLRGVVRFDAGGGQAGECRMETGECASSSRRAGYGDEPAGVIATPASESELAMRPRIPLTLYPSPLRDIQPAGWADVGSVAVGIGCGWRTSCRAAVSSPRTSPLRRSPRDCYSGCLRKRLAPPPLKLRDPAGRAGICLAYVRPHGLRVQRTYSL
eukprot:scaffold3766_cov124-Isochrysis_galbana.AAC.5